MSSFSLYFFGVVVVVIALAVGATLLGVPPIWTAIGAAVIIGFGVMGGVRKTREKDDTPTSD